MEKVTTNEIAALEATEMLHLFASRSLSPVEVMHAQISQCERKNPGVNAVFGLRAEYALENAKASERRWAIGAPEGVLDGVPVLLKDSIRCEGFAYFHGSATYDGTPADHDAPPAARVKAANGLVFAKTTMPDYGMLAAGVSSAFGIIRNPWNTSKSPGGSSAGSGAAVAAGMAPLAVGTDIAGSVRLPCAHNGLVGLKPSRGRIPHLAPSPIRAAGPMARSVKDLSLLMSVLVGPDARDYESAPPCDATEYLSVAQPSGGFFKGKRIGLMADMGFGQTPDKRVLELIETQALALEQEGATVDPVPKVATSDPMGALYALVQSRAYYELHDRPQSEQSKLLPHIAKWCRETEVRSAHDLSTALLKLEEFKSRTVATLAPYDYLISPALTVVSFPADQVAPIPSSHFAHCSYQIPFNQIGAPALSINVGFIDGMPVGMQIAGKLYDDLGVLKFAYAYEELRGFKMNWPM